VEQRISNQQTLAAFALAVAAIAKINRAAKPKLAAKSKTEKLFV